MKNKLENFTALYIMATIVFCIVLLVTGGLIVQIVSGLLIGLFGYVVYLGAQHYIKQKKKKENE